LAHGYHTLQHWNQWLHRQFLGNKLLDAEQKVLKDMLKRHFGKHAVLIGVPQQYHLLDSSVIPFHTLVSPLSHREEHPGEIEANLQDVPILTGSTDLVMLPHTLEFVEHPRHLLAEACRIVKPEGLIVVVGFNPFSAWGIRKLFTRRKSAPWSGNFINAQKIKNWLRLSDFEIEQQKSILFRPPVDHEKLYQKLTFLERMGSICCPFIGGAYIIIARAKVIPLTPIRMQWKQRLSNLRIAPTITGTIARQSEPHT